MIFQHCGIIGERVNTGNKKECLCDKCCFNDTEIDCIDKVPCLLGGYYRQMSCQEEFTFTGSQALQELISLPPPMIAIRYYPSLKLWLATKGKRVVAQAKTELGAIKARLKIMQADEIEAIRESKRVPHNSQYIFTHRSVVLSTSHSQKKAKEEAIGIITDYYDYLIKDIKNGTTKQN